MLVRYKCDQWSHKINNYKVCELNIMIYSYTFLPLLKLKKPVWLISWQGKVTTKLKSFSPHDSFFLRHFPWVAQTSWLTLQFISDYLHSPSPYFFFFFFNLPANFFFFFFFFPPMTHNHSNIYNHFTSTSRLKVYGKMIYILTSS